MQALLPRPEPAQRFSGQIVVVHHVDVIVNVAARGIGMRHDHVVRRVHFFREPPPERVDFFHILRTVLVELVRREILRVAVHLNRSTMRRRASFGESHERLRRLDGRRHGGGARVAGRAPLFRLPARPVERVGNRSRGRPRGLDVDRAHVAVRSPRCARKSSTAASTSASAPASTPSTSPAFTRRVI